MIKKITILLFLSSYLILSAEIISGGTGIQKLIFARSVERAGVYLGLNGQAVFSDSSDTDIRSKFNLHYGVETGFDVIFDVPIRRFEKDTLSYTGFGDISLGVKYNFGFENSKFKNSILAKVSLPTGYQPEEKEYKNIFTTGKKSFELGYLFDYGVDELSIHGNFSFETLDNFKLDAKEDMSINYAIGVKYRPLTFYDRSFWLKWEFETTNYLFEYPDYIRGSNYLGAATDIYRGLSANVAWISDLYDEKSDRIELGFSYSMKGSKRIREKKLLEQYDDIVKVGIIEFENENINKTYDKVSDKLYENFQKIDNVKISTPTTGDISLFENREKNIANLNRLGKDIIIQGRIIRSEFVRSSRFYLPLLINIPQIGYEIEVEVMVVDANQNRVMYRDVLSAEETLAGGVQLFRYSKDDKKYHLTASEEYELVRKCVDKLALVIITELSSRIEE